MKRRGINRLGVAVVVCILTLPTAVEGKMVLQNATSHLWVSAGGVQDETVSGPATLDGDEQWFWGDYYGTGQVVAESMTAFGAKPLAYAAASASTTAGTSGSSFPVAAEARTTLNYEVGLVQKFPLPSVLPNGVVAIETEVNGFRSDTSGYASVNVWIDNMPFPLSANGTALHGKWNLYFAPNTIHKVKLWARAYALSSSGYTEDRQAAVDPVFSFNQDWLDSLKGPNTFPLADYFELRYSPNLNIGPVPEPSALVIWSLIALWGVGIGGRRR